MGLSGFQGVVLIALNALCILVYVSSSSRSEYYRAAVFEHVRFSDLSYPSQVIVKRNLLRYRTAATTAALNEADIIVFPEWGLHPHDKQNRSSLLQFVEDVPDPKTEKWNPCNQTEIFHKRPILTELSCIAKENNIYLVANMADKKLCQPVQACDANGIEACSEVNDHCPEDGLLFYNTNVVFDREGTLIARYYKIHLYFETFFSEPQVPEPAYFDTDFGASFTTCVCFDLSFKEAVDALNGSTVTNVAYPTYWYDHVPFAIATQIHQSWAMTNKVNLLSANVHLPGTGTLGSAIYSGAKGAVIYTHNPDGKAKLLISNVPKSIGSQEDSFPLNTKRFIIEDENVTETDDDGVENYKDQCQLNVLGEAKDYEKDYRCFISNTTDYEFIKLENDIDQLEICSNGLCCSLNYRSNSMQESYYLGIMRGNFEFYDSYSFGVEVCFLARCDSIDDVTCSNYPLHSETTFQYAELKGNFSAKYVYPSALANHFKLVPVSKWNYDGESKITFRPVLDSDNSLLFFGLYGRNYDSDVTNL